MLLYVAGFSNLLKDITQRSGRNSVNTSSTKEFVVYGEAALSDCNTLKNTATNTSEYIQQDFTFR